jgi:hypothetical protein
VYFVYIEGLRQRLFSGRHSRTERVVAADLTEQGA